MNVNMNVYLTNSKWLILCFGLTAWTLGLAACNEDTDVPYASSDASIDTESTIYDSTDEHSDSEADSEDSDTVMLKDTATTTDDVDSASSTSNQDTATALNDSDSATASGDTATQDQQTDTAVTLVDGIVQLDGCDPDGWCAMDLPGTFEGIGAAVHGCSATDVWAVLGEGDLLHYDGDQWRPAAVQPDVKLHDVFCVGVNDVWGLSLEAVAVHFDGSSWTEVSIPGDVQVWTVWANKDTAILTGGESGVWQYKSGSLTQIIVPQLPVIDEFEYSGEVYEGGFYGVWGTSAENIWVGAQGFFLHITESGPVWVQVPGDMYMSWTIYSIQSVSESDLWAIVFNTDVDETGTEIREYVDGEIRSIYWPHHAVSDFAGIGNFAMASEQLIYATGHGSFINGLDELHLYKNGEWSYVLQFNSKYVGSIWAAPDGALFVPVEGHILHHPGF